MPKEVGSKSGGFPCTHCGGATECKDSRLNKGVVPVRRRRWWCRDCGGRFTTFESVIKEPNKKNVQIHKLQNALDVFAEHIREIER